MTMWFVKRVKELLNDSLAHVPTEPPGTSYPFSSPEITTGNWAASAESSNFTYGVHVANLRATVQTTSQVTSLTIQGFYLINLVNVYKNQSLIFNRFRPILFCLNISRQINWNSYRNTETVSFGKIIAVTVVVSFYINTGCLYLLTRLFTLNI